MTNAVNLASAAGTGFAFRNRIINGNFDIWQRGTSFGLNEYTADRWRGSTGTTGTVSRQTFTLGQTDVPGNPEYFIRFNKTGTGDYALLEQRIEDVRTFAGGQCTLSFYAKASSATTGSVGALQVFGAGGSATTGPTNLFSLTTSWQKFTINYTLPSVSGKTIGADNSLQIRFYPAQSDSSWTGSFDLAQVQFEAGSVATPFERRPISLELALCQRYCFVWLNDTGVSQIVGPMHVWATDRVYGKLFDLPVVMRALPTCSATGNFIPTNAGGTATTNFTSTLVSSPTRYAIGTGNWSGSSGLVAGNVSTVYALAGASIIASAEL